MEGAKSYEAGRAEACGTLCRIFCSHKTGEEILPVYLSRFYIALYYGLRADKGCSGTVLSNIVFNSTDLLRIDLDGVQILLPQVLKALELLLSDLSPKFKYDEQIPLVELRKASTHLLLSAICLPLHFKELPIKSLFDDPKDTREPQHVLTFLSLKKRMIELLLRALTVENDAANTEMLLGGLILCVQDLALCEEAQANMARSISDRPPSPDTTTTQLDNSHGLFGHAASLVCNRLMASWKLDLNIALAAMEVLSGLAKVKLSNPYPLMCKRTVNWICEFIVYQCSRPAPAHSKDLHSMLVAAFHCLTLWLVAHNYLMQDKECLHCVLEVVELGISGSKSQNRASDVPKLKGEKELKPVSMRVREAAEGLLAVIMDHVGSFPPPCGPESVCSLLDEETLLKYCKDGGVPEQGTPFRYFVLDGTTIVALLEQSLGNDQDPLPTVTSIIRGPFGRHAWTMQLRHLPKMNKVSSRVYLQEASRPQPVNDVGVHHNVKHRYFPEVVDQIPLVQADKSIPKLENTMADNQSEMEKMQAMILQQTAFENRVKQRVKEERAKTKYPDPKTECKQPSVCHEFQTARLFLSHYGFLSLEALKEPSSSSVPPSLVTLDPLEAGFAADLEHLDSMSCRVYDTVHVFYVKSGQKMPFEILSNVSEKKNVQPVFMELLRSLGWPVDVHKHAGWTGHISTSWKIQPISEEDGIYPADTGGSIYDGQKQVLYWADVGSEVAFVVPSSNTYVPPARRTSDISSEKSPEPMSKNQRPLDLATTKPKSLSLDLDNKPIEKSSSGGSLRENLMTPTEGSGRTRRFGRSSLQNPTQESKVFVVWLESFEDHENFPAAELLQSTSTGLPESAPSSSSSLGKLGQPNVSIIFIHSLQNGLFRIHMQGQCGKIHMGIPLVSGMVISRRCLGTLIRQTAINICRRKRLENDSYQPPHVRRKLKIKEIVDKYRNKLREPEFYTSLFEDVSKR